MIGCGYVGAASVFSLMQSGLFSEIALIDVDKEKAEGEAMDISHGIPFSKHMKIYAGDYEDVRDAGMVIITAGANQKPNETRLDSLLDQYVDEGCELRKAIAELVEIGVYLRVVYTQRSAIMALDEMFKAKGIKPYPNVLTKES